jgi:sentrin-specific protease 1
MHPKAAIETAIPRVLPTPSSTPVMTLRTKKLVVVDKFVMKAMEIETEALLRNQNPSTVCALAVALAQSGRSVMALYDDAGQEHGDDYGVSAIMKKWKSLSLRQEKQDESPDLKSALRALECSVDSGSKHISNWEGAKEVLSSVVQFPDETLPSEHDVSRSGHEVEDYRNRIKEATGVKDIDVHFEESREQWKRLAHARSPQKLADSSELAVVGSDYVAKSDQLLAETLARAYEEREERMKSEVARELEAAEREKQAGRLISSLLRPLTPEEQEIVNNAMYGEGPAGEILSQFGTDSVQRQSMHRLQPGQWLNDEVIHYFYVMLAKRDEEMCRLDPSRKRNHFFKSFFMTKLLNEGNADASKDGEYEYRNVKRWSKKVPGKDIFKLDKIFFPINQGRMHWMCAVIHMKEKQIQMYDSMGGSGMHYLKSLFQYVKDEHMDKKGTPLPDIEQWELVGYQSGTPCQRNGFDCGVFTCMFADFLSRDWPLVFAQEHITECRERIALSIMRGSAII